MPLGYRIHLSGPGRRPGRLVISGLAAAVVSGLTLAGPARADSTVNPSTAPVPSPAAAAAKAAADMSGGPSDGLLVRFHDTASAPAVEKAVAAAGGTVEDVAGATGFVRVSTGTKSPAAVEAALATSPVVENVEPNRIRKADMVPNDPRYSSQASYLQEMHLPDAWDTTTGNDSMILAITDAGWQLNHPALAGRRVPWGDFDNTDPTPDDDFGHGTMVAGIAAAITNNGQGVSGGAWRGKIMPVKVLDSQGSANDDDIAAGITFAVDHGASVINLSLGGPGASTTLQTAVDYATSHNVVVVAAAGNDGDQGVTAATTPHYPAACNGVISVGATDAAANHASWSSYGSWVDVVAPGVGIVSTTRPTSSNPSLYVSGSGTSFSSPLVAAVAFLMRSADPNSDEALPHAERRRLLALPQPRPGLQPRQRPPPRRPHRPDPQRPHPRLGADAERPGLLHGRLRRRHLRLRRRPLRRVDGREAPQRPGAVAGARPRRLRLLAGGVGRWRLRLRRSLPGLDGRGEAQRPGHRDGAVRERLPDGGQRRRRLRLLRPAVLRFAGRHGLDPADRLRRHQGRPELIGLISGSRGSGARRRSPAGSGGGRRGS